MPLPLSEDLKWRIVFLRNDRFSRKKIAQLLYISKGTVNKVLYIYAKWGSVIDSWKKLRGRRKIFNNQEMNVCLIILKNNKFKYLNLFKFNKFIYFILFRFCVQL